MTCPNGHRIRDGAAFCPTCGAPLGPRPSSTAPLGSDVSNAPPLVPGPTSVPRRRFRGRWLWVGVAALVALVLATVGFTVLRPTSGKSTPVLASQGRAACTGSSSLAPSGSATPAGTPPVDSFAAIVQAQLAVTGGQLEATIETAGPIVASAFAPDVSVSWSVHVGHQGLTEYQLDAGEAKTGSPAITAEVFPTSLNGPSTLPASYTISSNMLTISAPISEFSGLGRSFTWDARTVIEDFVSTTLNYQFSSHCPSGGGSASFPGPAGGNRLAIGPASTTAPSGPCWVALRRPRRVRR